MIRAHSIPLAVMAVAFLFCAQYGIRSEFAPDDMMNMANHLKRGPLQTVLDTVLFWTGAYRPLEGHLILSSLRPLRAAALPYRITGFGFSLFASLSAVLVLIGQSEHVRRLLQQLGDL